jgi:hypothetical protein
MDEYPGSTDSTLIKYSFNLREYKKKPKINFLGVDPTNTWKKAQCTQYLLMHTIKGCNPFAPILLKEYLV